MFTAIKETRAAVVFLIGEHAYKVKKPVNLGFADLTTLPARHAACLREVELNRRLAPDVYEGVATVLDPDGEVCEHLVVMRRLPDQRCLATMAHSGMPVDEHLRGVARQVAGLHAKARRGPEIDREGELAALRARWISLFEQVRGQPGSPVGSSLPDQIEHLVFRFLDGRAPLFEARIAEGRIVEGHGDLRAEDVFCLDDGPRILDCLEFDERRRFLDGLDDAAFLAMDLERLAAPRLAESFLRWYVEFSGDPAPPALWHHYLAYRAFVQAKAACLRDWQGDRDAGLEARRLAELARRHLRAGAVTMVLVGGDPATGKTTLGGAIADRLGHTLLRADRIRKELAASLHSVDEIHRPEHTERTYAELLSRAERLLGLGEPVVLDASWTDEPHRAMAAQVARHTSSDLVALRCTVMPQIAAERLATREPGPSGAAMAPWPDAIEIDTGVPREQALARALSAIHAPEPDVPWRFLRPRMEPD